MQYQVPQIEVEDKIFGPLTLKQFIFIAIGAGIIFFSLTIFELWLVILIAIPIGSASTALAFLKVNGRPLPKITISMFRYAASPRLYIWRKVKKQIKKVPDEKPETTGQQLYTPELTRNRLKELAWSLDIKQEIEKE